MATQTGSYDFKAAKAAHDEASQTASNYIFKTTGHDAWVCDENAGPNESTGEAYGPSDANPTTGWRIGSVFELVRQGVSWFKLWVENNIVKLRLGKVDSGHIILDADSMDVLDSSSDTIASFGADGAQIGKSDESHVIIGSNSIKMSESTSSLFTIEFDGLVNIINSGGDTSAKPYSNNDINSIAAMLNTGYTVNDSIVFDPEGNRTLYTIVRNVVNNRFGNIICSPNLYIYYDDTSGIFEPSTLMTPQVDHDSIPTLIAMGETSVKATGDNLEIYASGIATGNNSIASGQYSHAQNYMTRAASNYQTALGKCNVEDADDAYAVIVGNGTSDNARSNALTVGWDATTKLWHPSIQRGTVPSSAIYGGGGALVLADHDGDQIGYFQPIQLTDGSEGIQVGVSNEDGTDWNNIQLTFNGATPGVSVSRKKEWRDALGALARVPGSQSELPNCTATNNVYPIVLGNSFANNGEISYMSAANFRNMIGAAMYNFYQATGASGTISTTAGTITPITLVTTGAVSNGSGFSISNGGIKVANAGKYRVTASMYILGTNATFKGVYVKKNNNSTGSTGELIGLHYPYTASGVQVGPKIVSLAANDVLYLCGRSGGVAGTIYTNNAQTYLLVERVV